MMMRADTKKARLRDEPSFRFIWLMFVILLEDFEEGW
jgi:hypothetical protein